MKPHREMSAGTYALERGIRNTPNPAAPTPAHASAAQQPFTTASLRPVVSRFGGMVMESHAVHIPQQAGSVSVGAMDDDTDFDSRCKPSCTNVYAGIPGYTGYKPHGAHHSSPWAWTRELRRPMGRRRRERGFGYAPRPLKAAHTPMLCLRQSIRDGYARVHICV